MRYCTLTVLGLKLLGFLVRFVSFAKSVLGCVDLVSYKKRFIFGFKRFVSMRAWGISGEDFATNTMFSIPYIRKKDKTQRVLGRNTLYFKLLAMEGMNE